MISEFFRLKVYGCFLLNTSDLPLLLHHYYNQNIRYQYSMPCPQMTSTVIPTKFPYIESNSYSSTKV